ncbi:MAG: GNAT family N-acetyltransferase [Deltaproteobacteria bacterium]|nr:GNAT family N-acetyltransferase [Deltaproteobacteria bacterium]
MEYAIQRRGIFLAPPSNTDLDWLFMLFELPEIWAAFAFERNGRMAMLRKFREGELVIGIMHRVKPRKRVGFVIMFPPGPDRDFWEFSYAVPDPLDRDAFSALSATDAMAHYMFDHLGVEAMGWRAWEDNRAARAVIQRLGYQPTGESWVENRRQILFRLSREGWAARKAKLDRGEAEHPSGIGSTFVTLGAFPWTPIEAPERTDSAREPAEPVRSPAARLDSAPGEPVKRSELMVASDSMPTKKKPSSIEAEAVSVVPTSDAEIELSIQAMGRRDIYAPLGWDRSAPVLFSRALRKGEVELMSVRLGAEGPWIGFVVIVPPKSSTFRLWELDIALVRLKEQTHERRVETTRAAVAAFFDRHPDAESVIAPLPSSSSVLIEAAEEAGLERVPESDLSPLPFRRALELIAYRARRTG